MATVTGAWLWTGYIGTWSFVAKYCAFICIATIGVLQLIATRWKLRGISFFNNKKWGYAFGTAALLGAFIWFFGFIGLDLTKPTFDTPPQLAWLTLSVFIAILVTLGISSMINRKRASPEEAEPAEKDGIEVLKHKTYWQAIIHYFSRGEKR